MSFLAALFALVGKFFALGFQRLSSDCQRLRVPCNFRFIAVFVALLCLTAAPVLAAQKTPPAPRNYIAALQAKYGHATATQTKSIRLAGGGREVHFCGQCSVDSACGTQKCCGPSSCRECKDVVTCP